jgi:UDP-N-acetylglucosamine transferase subunit ALG13
VSVIKHDRESQIQTLLKDWHQMLSNAGEGTFHLFQREFKARVVAGSDFQISSSKDSAGIQLADIVLWLTKRSRESGDIGEIATKFLERVERQSTPFDLSIDASEQIAAAGMAQVDAGITSPDQLVKGRELLEKMEARRQEGLKEFPLPV